MSDNIFKGIFTNERQSQITVKDLVEKIVLEDCNFSNTEIEEKLYFDDEVII